MKPPPLPRGFRAAGVSCGIKRAKRAGAAKRPERDLALFFSDRPAAAAALFTTNRFPAAPVLLSSASLMKTGGAARAIVANSGCANAATGERGLAAARRTARAFARIAGIDAEQVLVASTGVIGEHLPAGQLISALPAAFAALSSSRFKEASRAILTTDTTPKTATAVFGWKGRSARITGCAKGAGMIHPRLAPAACILSRAAAPERTLRSRPQGHHTLHSRGASDATAFRHPRTLVSRHTGRPPRTRHATMLAFVFTDAVVPPRSLRRALIAASPRSFERISVDGDTSTNDSVFVLANGASGLEVHSSDGSFDRFLHALESVAFSLARQIVRDGEGARRVLDIEVSGAASREAADRVAREIARSPLVKTALAGADANWGRILSAAGAAGVPFDPMRADLWIEGVRVARAGAAVRYDRRRVEGVFRRDEVPVRLLLGRGPGQARFLTCDLTEDYVRINASYRS